MTRTLRPARRGDYTPGKHLVFRINGTGTARAGRVVHIHGKVIEIDTAELGRIICTTRELFVNTADKKA